MKPQYFSQLAKDSLLISLPVWGSRAGSFYGAGLFRRGGVHVLVGVGAVPIVRDLGLGLTAVGRMCRVGGVGGVGAGGILGRCLVGVGHRKQLETCYRG